jgi:hypothetical protein
MFASTGSSDGQTVCDGLTACNGVVMGVAPTRPGSSQLRSPTKAGTLRYAMLRLVPDSENAF